MKQTKYLLLFTAIFISSMVLAQNRTVRGNVSDNTGLPVVGASVIDTGDRTRGTVTDLDGNFSLVCSEGSSLEISCMGYTTVVAETGDKETVNVILTEDTEFLDEVVVIGYGTVRKRDLTGSVASLGAKDVKDAPVANIGQALQGKVSGVQIVDAGKPGDNVTIKIRGLGTINNSDPLVVIDGVPTDLSLSAINTADVERIDVLKDASATAIYGSRGANGVVMITTKKGQTGKGQVSVSANVALQNAMYIPKMLNAAEYADYSNDMLSAAGLSTNPLWVKPEELGKGTDWVQELLQPGLMQNYTVSYSGGNEKSHYYVSGGFLDQSGIVKTVGYQRFTFQSNSDAQVLDWLKFTNNITFSADNKKSGSYSIGDAMRALPTQSVKNEDGSWSGPDGQALWYGDVRNPVGTLYTNSNKTNGYNFLANVSAEISFTKWLKFKSTFGFDAKIWFDDNFTEAYPYKPTPVEETTRYQGVNRALTYLWDNYLTFDYTVGKKHYINVMAGMSAQWNDMKYFNATKAGFLFKNVHEFDNGTTEKAIGGSASDWAMLSYMARANYSYDERYLITATFRADGSSRFGPSNRWGFFPSASVAWRMSKESWWKKDSVVNDFKIRAGYGVTGNDKIGSYAYIPTYDTGSYIFGDSVSTTLIAKSMANGKIHWEEVHQANVGIDLSLWNSRLDFTIDAYLKNTKDMLVKAAIPITSGFEDTTTTFTNAGKVRNVGTEFSIHSVNFDSNSDGFRWETTLTCTYNKNRIVSLNSDTPLYQNEKNGAYVTMQRNGCPINVFYGYVTDGLFQTIDEVKTHAFQEESTAPGDIRFKDLNSDGVINEKDRTIIGDPNPDWMFSMVNNFSYKGFELSIYLQGVAGLDIFNVNNLTNIGMSSANNQIAAAKYRWKGYGTSTVVPRAVYGDPNHNARISDRFVEDGSYLRLKNISLSYNFPRKWMDRIHFNGIKVILSCENVATMTKYLGFDPEVGVDGLDQSRYPLARTFSLGVNFNF
ncbi:MAG: SusC/RagA family TonB-linked outer membrane protein [Candidatus Cryptobacteroides sp.]